jgi:hypothetical protein
VGGGARGHGPNSASGSVTSYSNAAIPNKVPAKTLKIQPPSSERTNALGNIAAGLLSISILGNDLSAAIPSSGGSAGRYTKS